MATVIIASIVAILFVAIIASEIHKKKTGKSACGCSCGSCDGCSARPPGPALAGSRWGVASFALGDPGIACAFLFYIS